MNLMLMLSTNFFAWFLFIKAISTAIVSAKHGKLSAECNVNFNYNFS